MSAPSRRRIADGLEHFQHGPIDCICRANGPSGEVAAAMDHAWAQFDGLLAGLAQELPMLRADLSAPASVLIAPRGPVASRMVAACRPHAIDGRFITAMAAVAGSVADEVVGHLSAGFGIDRAWVNNGGDVAVYLVPETRLEVGSVADVVFARAGVLPSGRFTIEASSPVRGIATSGWRGRSFSFGIADAVTVLARTASVADAAATMIANEVDVAHPGILRRPADTIRDDTDLGSRLVTVAVPPLPPELVDEALARGAREAETEIAAGLIVACILSLQGRWRVCGDVGPSLRLPEPARPC